MQEDNDSTNVESARTKWIKASDAASKLHTELFQTGSGYGSPDERAAGEHKLASSRLEAERLLREYYDIDRRFMNREMLKLKRSQTLATWASFTIAVVVGVATVFDIVVAFLTYSGIISLK